MKTNHCLPLLLVLLSAGSLGAASPRPGSSAASGSTRTVNVAAAETSAPRASGPAASRQAQIAALRSELNALDRDLLNAEQQSERRRREAEKLQLQAPAASSKTPPPAQRADTRSKIDPRLHEAGEQVGERLAQRRRAEELRAELEALQAQIKSWRAQRDAKQRKLAALEAAR